MLLENASHLCPNKEKYQTNANIDSSVGVELLLSAIAETLLQFSYLGGPKHPVFVPRVVRYDLVALGKQLALLEDVLSLTHYLAVLLRRHWYQVRVGFSYAISRIHL